MKNITDFITEASMNEYNELIEYIQNIIDNNKNLEKDELNEVMQEVREKLKGYSDYDFTKVERNFKIKKAYPNSKTNIEQWVLSKICKK